jgi:cell division septum initiation protein DivIVA
MPKKDKKATKKDKARDPADVVEAVRGAVERTFQATTGGTEGARDRGRSLLDDVASAAQRIRESFDDLRVLEDVRGLRAEIEALSRRVAELEKQAAKPAAATGAGTAKATPARRAPAKRTAAKAPAKPSAARTAARTTGPKPKPATRSKPAASRSSSSGSG